MIFMSFARRTLGLAALGAALCAACASGALSHGQRVRVDKLISQFENSTSTIQYCYVEALGDGRGYTVGRAGFTSATGDLLEVASRYTRAVPDNPLSELLPRLRELARRHSGSIEGLDRLPEDWRATCRDPRQRHVQDLVVDEQYYRPAVRHATRLKLHLPLSLAAIYDASIQHGDGPDPDGVPAMLRRAAKRAGGTPASGVGEKRFVRAFLYVRRRTLAHAHDPSTRRAWAASVGRVDAWKYLVRTGQWQLRSPIKVRTRLYHLTIR